MPLIYCFILGVDILDYLMNIVPAIAMGLQVTIKIFIITIVLSLPLGILMSLARISKIMPLRKFMGAYIYVMRGSPLMLQILFIYYGLPFIVEGFQLSDFPAAIIAFVFNYAAYFAEIFRGGIQSIELGQYEGAKVLGLTYVQTMKRIILPQVIKRVLPPISNETINLLKDTSLVYILAMNDILRITRSIVQRDFDTTAFIVAAVFYLFFTFILTKVFAHLEKRFAVYDE